MSTKTLSRWFLVALLALVGFGLTACGDDDDDDDAGSATTAAEAPEEEEDGGGGAGGGGQTVEIADFTFPQVEAAPGEAITFTNADEAPHTVTADGDEFDSGEIAGGAEGEITAPDEAGEYDFHCDVHPNMSGKLVVA